MDKSRQQFEEVFSKEHPNETDSLTDFLIKDTAWNFWKLSRDSLEVELPDLGDVILDDYFIDGYNDALEDVKAVLLDNGVKVK